MPKLLNAYAIGTGFTTSGGTDFSNGVGTTTGLIQIAAAPEAVDIVDNDKTFQNDSSVGLSDDVGDSNQYILGTNTNIFIDGVFRAVDPATNITYTVATIDTFDSSGDVDGAYLMFFPDQGSSPASLNIADAITLPVGTNIDPVDGSWETAPTVMTYLDYVVDGTSGDDVIDASYTDDPDGDMVDSNDHSDGSNDDSIVAGAGNDTVYSGAGDDVVDGGTGGDSLFGGDGDDLLYGGDGFDRLYAGSGNDSLFGGAGHDRFYSGADNGSQSAQYFDGGIGSDQFHLDQSHIGGDTIVGGESNNVWGEDRDEIQIWGNGTVNITYTGDEAGEITVDGESSSFSEIEALWVRDAESVIDMSANSLKSEVLTGNLDDTFIGGSGVDRIYTFGGDDSIAGGAGNDHIFAYTGADTVSGGAGDDQISIGWNYDFDMGETGVDTDVDTLVLEDGSGNDTIFGFGAPELDVDGNPIGDDQLDVSGLHDADGYPVNVHDVTISDDGDGNAVLTFPNGESITLMDVAPSEVDTPAKLIAMGIPAPDETVSGTAGADVIDVNYTGDPHGDMVDANDNLAGNNDDIIEAGLGDDTVYAGSGDDLAYGGADDDSIDGCAGDDVIYGDNGPQQNLISDGSFEDDPGNSSMAGSLPDWYNWNTATPDLQMEDVYETYHGDAAAPTDGYNYLHMVYNDVAQVGEFKEGLSQDLETPLEAGKTYTLTLDAAAGEYDNASPTGAPLQVEIYGNATAGMVGAGKGDLPQGAVLLGSANVTVDYTTGQMGQISFTFTPTTDIATVSLSLVDLDYDGHYATLVLDNVELYEVLGEDGNDTIDGGEGDDTIFGEGGNDSLIGGIGQDSIDGGTGNDTISGGEGDDTIDGGDGRDRIAGGEGDDSISGGADVDYIYGGEGNDTLSGGTGNDIIYGGTGEDSILGGDGNDTIYGDFDPSSSLTDLLVDGTFEGATPTNGSQAHTLPDWYSWNEHGTPDLSDESGWEANWSASASPTDGTNYVTLITNSTNLEGLSQDLATPLQAGVTYTITLDVGAGEGINDGTTGAVPTQVEIYGNATAGMVGVGSGGKPAGVVLLGSADVTTDFTIDNMGQVSITFTPTTDIETITISLNDTDFQQNTASIVVDNVSLYEGGFDDTIDGGAGDDNIIAGAGDDYITGGLGNDGISGGTGDDTFVYNDGDGADRIFDFGSDDSGSINDGDHTNNDFVDLTGFYNTTTLANVNGSDADPTNDYETALGLLRADAADGTIDGIIDGVDHSASIGDIDLSLMSGGQAVTGTDITFDNTGVPCFVSGTLIATARGAIPVEQLVSGDSVQTRDNGFRKIVWIGSKTVAATGKLAPIRIEKGLLKNDRALWLSPNHRVLHTGWQAELMFGSSEVLHAAKSLLHNPGVRQVEGGMVEYFHIMFEQHEIILSDQTWTESFHPGQVGLDAFNQDTRDELVELFPELNSNILSYGDTARVALRSHEAKLLFAA